MEFAADLNKILRKALSGGGTFCDIFIERKTSSRITCEENKIQGAITGIDQGVGLRVIKDNRTISAYTNSFLEEDVLNLAEKLSKAGDGENNKNKNKNTIDGHNIGEVENYSHTPPSKKVVETSIKLDWVKRGNEIIRSWGNEIVQAKLVYSDMAQDIIIANSDGLYLSDQRQAAYFSVLAVAARNGIIQSGYDVLGGNKEFDIASDEPWVETCKTAAERSLLMLDAKPAAGGRMPVVLSGRAGGTMVHEAIGHGLEADLAQEGLSVYAGRIGEQVASSLITIVDDATLSTRSGTYNFDDEGTKAQRTVLVENGILKNYMYDNLSATKVGAASTGNGRRESYRHRPIVRMTNTIILPGESLSEDIVKAVKKGLFVVSMGGGEVNTVNGDFVFEVTEGYTIEDGKITEPVRGATLCGNGPEILSQIEYVGNDLGFGVGVCGKDGQHANVSDAQPTLLLKEITVGGVVS